MRVNVPHGRRTGNDVICLRFFAQKTSSKTVLHRVEEFLDSDFVSTRSDMGKNDLWKEFRLHSMGFVYQCGLI
jgi:hypothetical protein